MRDCSELCQGGAKENASVVSWDEPVHAGHGRGLLQMSWQ